MVTLKSLLFMQKECENGAEIMQELSRERGVIMTSSSQRYPNRLKQTIKQSGFTVERMAAETDIPLRTLFDYCAGRVPVPRDRLEVLAHALGYSMEYLVPKMIQEEEV